MIRYSIIVTVYNSERYIKRCLESILVQTFKDFELIVVDDGSTDGSYGIEKSFDDYRIKIIRKDNEGVENARKDGLKEATGEYIVYVDSDDFLSKDFLQLVDEAVNKYQADVICCGSVEVRGNKSTEKPVNAAPGLYDRKKLESVIFPYLIEDVHGRYFTHTLWGKVFKREKVMQYQFASNGFNDLGEDVVVTIPMIFCSQSIYIMKDCLYNYVWSENSITRGGHVYDIDVVKRMRHALEDGIDLSYGDFKAQLDRCITHMLFNVFASQYNDRSRKYKETCRFIGSYLEDKVYMQSVRDCVYRKYWKGMFAKTALYFRLYFLIFLYNRLIKR